MKLSLILSYIILCTLGAACMSSGETLRTGADRMEEYLPLLRDKNFALVANHTSLVGGLHLVDTGGQGLCP